MGKKYGAWETSLTRENIRLPGSVGASGGCLSFICSDILSLFVCFLGSPRLSDLRHGECG